MIAIIDYGMGNLRSVQKGFERVGFDAVVTRDVGQIQAARGVVLPGVGAFNACMENLGKLGLIEPIRDVVHRQKPFLGICLGFQLLFSESEEFGKQKGLELFPGKVVGFRADKNFLRALVSRRARRSLDRDDDDGLRSPVRLQHRHRPALRLSVSS